MDGEVQQAMQVAKENGISMKAGNIWCICPEMKTDGIVRSKGGETVSTWKHRQQEREEGKDVPIGGCICTIGDDITLIVDNLVVSRES